MDWRNDAGKWCTIKIEGKRAGNTFFITPVEDNQPKIPPYINIAQMRAELRLSESTMMTKYTEAKTDYQTETQKNIQQKKNYILYVKPTHQSEWIQA